MLAAVRVAAETVFVPFTIGGGIKDNPNQFLMNLQVCISKPLPTSGAPADSVLRREGGAYPYRRCQRNPIQASCRRLLS